MDQQEAELVMQLTSKYGVRRVLGAMMARAEYETESAENAEERVMWERLGSILYATEMTADKYEGDHFKEKA